MSDSQDPTLQAEREIGLINAFFPILPRLGNRFAGARPWQGVTIGLNMHLTALTGALVRELVLGGGTFVVSAASPATTHSATVAMMRSLGVQVFTGGDLADRHLQVLDAQPQLIVDVGFELIQTLLTKRPQQASTLRVAIEASRSGIVRLREQASLPFPVVNINDGRLKRAVENRHGVGEAIWQAVAKLTGMHLSGRRVAVVGYGSVGCGLAAYARAAGMSVEVVEADPVRRLFAHYDGFPTPSLTDALGRVGIVVTATGGAGALSMDHIAAARGGLVLLNAGHGGDEIDVKGLRQAAASIDHIGDQVVTYTLQGGSRVTVLGDGYPLNIVLNSGSPEPVLLQFALLGLAMEWVIRSELPVGEVAIPPKLESEAAVFALDALNP